MHMLVQLFLAFIYSMFTHYELMEWIKSWQFMKLHYFDFCLYKSFTRAQRHINLEIPVFVRSLRLSFIGTWMGDSCSRIAWEAVNANKIFSQLSKARGSRSSEERMRRLINPCPGVEDVKQLLVNTDGLPMCHPPPELQGAPEGRKKPFPHGKRTMKNMAFVFCFKKGRNFFHNSHMPWWMELNMVFSLF